MSMATHFKSLRMRQKGIASADGIFLCKKIAVSH